MSVAAIGFNNRITRFPVNHNGIPTRINPNPTARRHTFGGWWNGSVRANLATMRITGNMTLRSNWAGDLYTVSFGRYNLPDGTQTPAKNSFQVRYSGQTHNLNLRNHALPHIPGKYRFMGWANSAENARRGRMVATTTTVKQNTRLYPVYEDWTYTVTMDNETGSKRITFPKPPLEDNLTVILTGTGAEKHGKAQKRKPQGAAITTLCGGIPSVQIKMGFKRPQVQFLSLGPVGVLLQHLVLPL